MSGDRRCTWGLLLLCALPCSVGLGESFDRLGGRMIRRYDFEETINGRKVGQFERLPLAWYVMGRKEGVGDVSFTRIALHRRLVQMPGYPPWTQVRYDDRHSTSGRYSFYLGLDGGNAGAFLRVGALPAVPGSDYLITASVRTEDLAHAGARLSACLVDGVGRRIDGSAGASEPLHTAGAWRRVSTRLKGDFPEASWIGVQIELLQSQVYRPQAAAEHRIRLEQIRGAAWFDDIEIWQVPRLSLGIKDPVNIVREPQIPSVVAGVRDPSGQLLHVRVVVRDHWGVAVARMDRQTGGGLPPLPTWTPDLPACGWYEAELSVWDGDGVAGPALAHTRSSFLWMPQERPRPSGPLRGFTLNAGRVHERELPNLESILDRTRLGSVVISPRIEDPGVPAAVERGTALRKTVERLVSRRLSVTFSLQPPMSETKKDSSGQDALWLLSEAGGSWPPGLYELLAEFGHDVDRWQLGPIERPSAFYRPNLAKLSRRAAAAMKEAVPSPRLILPWSLTQTLRSDLDRTITPFFVVPPSVQPGHIGAYLDRMPAAFLPAGLHLNSHAAADLSHRRRCVDLALRMVLAWEAGARELSMNDAWATADDGRTWMPDSLLGVFASVAERLAGRRALGRLDLGPQFTAVLFGSNENSPAGMLALWPGPVPRPVVSFEVQLGPDAEEVDLFGNRRALPTSGGRHRVEVADAPRFIEGLDLPLAMLRASFAVDPPFIESSQTTQHYELQLRNPWPHAVEGRLHLSNLEDWQIEPRRMRFNVAPGQTWRTKLLIRLPASQLAGHRRVRANVELVGHGDLRVELEAPVQVGIRDLFLDADVRVQTAPDSQRMDAIVTQQIFNGGSQTLSLYAHASIPGFPRQEQVVAPLRPGQRVQRRFRFAGAGTGTAAPRVRVGLRQRAGPLVLNKWVGGP
jgi:hypothetical protein